MNKYDAIINPAPGKKPPALGSFSVMVSQESDLRLLCKETGLDKDKFKKKLMTSRLCTCTASPPRFSLMGPIVGASYAAILLETLIAWGAKEILFLGCCGAVSPDVKVGDIIIPTSGIIDEGVSRHYDHDGPRSYPSEIVTEKIRQELKGEGLPFKEGAIWTTDAMFRETREKVEFHQKNNALGVEMEMSAIFSVGKFRNANIGGLLVVSDEISSFSWNVGFRNERFLKSCKDVCRVIGKLCTKG